MTKMTTAQREAILAAHTRVTWRGRIAPNVRAATYEALKREAWVKNGQVTTAGLIAAGVDMDALHADAIEANDAYDRVADWYAAAMAEVGEARAALEAEGVDMDTLYAEAVRLDEARTEGLENWWDAGMDVPAEVDEVLAAALASNFEHPENAVLVFASPEAMRAALEQGLTVVFEGDISPVEVLEQIGDRSVRFSIDDDELPEADMEAPKWTAVWDLGDDLVIGGVRIADLDEALEFAAKAGRDAALAKYGDAARRGKTDDDLIRLAAERERLAVEVRDERYGARIAPWVEPPSIEPQRFAEPGKAVEIHWRQF